MTPMQTTPDFMGLPTELHLMVYATVENKDLLSLRRTSRTLLEETNKEFANRYLTEIRLMGTVAEVKGLDMILRSSNLARLRSKVTVLHVYPPKLANLPTSKQGILWDSLPSKKRVLRLLKAMPNLEKFSLFDPYEGEIDVDVQYRGEDELLQQSQAIEAIFLPALARLDPDASNLTCLELEGFGIDGKLILNVLSTHRSSLRMVCITNCQLTGARRNTNRVTWKLLFSRMLTMELEEVFLSANLNSREEQIVLFAQSNGNCTTNQWSSSNPLLRPTSANFLHQHPRLINYNEVADTDYYAVFSRTSAFLLRGWVRKGLEILLGLAHYPLYWNPCRGIGFPGRYLEID
jgi:hypothetical protein